MSCDELIFRWLEQFVEGVTSFAQNEKGKNEFIETEIRDWLERWYEFLEGDDAEFARRVIPRMQNILYGNTIKRIGRPELKGATYLKAIGRELAVAFHLVRY